MPIKVYWCAAIVALWMSLCSFACSKQSDDVAAREADTNNITVDFRNFPATTVFTLIGDKGQGVFKFDSDSLKLYNMQIPGGEYRVHWKIVNTTEDAMYKAKWLNTQAGTSVEWKNGFYTYDHRTIHGTYTFTKERK
jgi:hypothetical protein